MYHYIFLYHELFYIFRDNDSRSDPNVDTVARSLTRQASACRQFMGWHYCITHCIAFMLQMLYIQNPESNRNQQHELQLVYKVLQCIGNTTGR
jgi:hypothetical protein